MILLAWMLLGLQAAALPGALDQACPVEFRGARLTDALGTLSGKLGVTYVFGGGLQPAVMEKEIRLTATHLTGQQAFRWLARLAGLEAVLVDGAFLIAPAKDLPTVWCAEWRSRPDTTWQAARTRRADIRWQDTPPARVAADISAGFGIDVIFHSDLLEEPPLVELQLAGATLEAVRESLAKQIGAVVEPFDGALYVHPASANIAPVSAPAAVAQPKAPVTVTPSASPMDASLLMERPLQTWPEFRDSLAQATGLPVSIRGDSSPPAIAALGAASDVLEAGRLLGYWTWTPPGSGLGALQVHPMTVQSGGGNGR